MTTTKAAPPSSTSPTPRYSPFRFLLKWVLLPYIIGWTLSKYLPQEIANRAVLALLPKSGQNVSRFEVPSESRRVEEDDSEPSDACWQRFLHSLDDRSTVEELVEKGGVSLVLHRNGDVEGCGVSTDFLDKLRWTLNTLEECPVAFPKYQVESILTSALHHAMKNSNCVSQEPDGDEKEGLLGYCDMGESKTPILLDHSKLIPVAGYQDSQQVYLPCHFHSREGVRITSFQKLVSRMVEEYKKKPCDTTSSDDQVCQVQQVDFYAVPAGRVFMFAPSHVGEIFDLPHIRGADPTQPVYLKVLSVSPRVFDIYNYFTKQESQELVDKAKKETSETHRIKRSSTGTSGYHINTRRTSESGFDTHGKVAQAVKRRCFSVLGFDEYLEGHSDGLQILRYNQTKAYTAHMDWIDDDGQTEHDYDSAAKGGNRYATILLYMTDLGEGDGGETVFVNAKPLQENPKTYQEALQEIRDDERTSAILTENSWEEKLVARCRSSLAVRPHSSRAVLFYSQLPNGQADPASLHGGCPVLTEEPKWAANLWVWNTPRAGFHGAPVIEERVQANKKKGIAPTVSANTPPKKHVTFANEAKNPEFENAQLFYLDQYWGRLGEGDPPHAVNSYEGQVWNVKVDGVTKKTFTVNKEPVQKYVV